MKQVILIHNISKSLEKVLWLYIPLNENLIDKKKFIILQNIEIQIINYSTDKILFKKITKKCFANQSND